MVFYHRKQESSGNLGASLFLIFMSMLAVEQAVSKSEIAVSPAGGKRKTTLSFALCLQVHSPDRLIFDKSYINLFYSYYSICSPGSGHRTLKWKMSVDWRAENWRFFVFSIVGYLCASKRFKRIRSEFPASPAASQYPVLIISGVSCLRGCALV